MRAGQVSIEYMIIAGFAFLFAVPIIALFYSQSHQLNEDISSSQADRVASELVDAANQVYYLGQPSKKTLLLYMPDNVQEISFDGRSIVIRVSSRAGDYEVVKIASTNLTGSIGTFSGLHKIEVKARLQDVLIADK